VLSEFPRILSRTMVAFRSNRRKVGRPFAPLFRGAVLHRLLEHRVDGIGPEAVTVRARVKVVGGVEALRVGTEFGAGFLGQLDNRDSPVAAGVLDRAGNLPAAPSRELTKRLVEGRRPHIRRSCDYGLRLSELIERTQNSFHVGSQLAQ